MKCMISPFSSCYYNIASEEYFMSQFDEDVFYLYINSPCIVVGRHQNASAEINQTYVHEQKIEVVRRQSGGGAVYHDHGNLNYGFITKAKGQEIDEVFREFTLPILNVLKKMGANASFSGRNDLVIEDKKISGVAQYHSGGKVLLHGTLLFDSDLTKLAAALNADPRKFQDKSVKSVKSRVSNIRPFLPDTHSIEEFTTTIIQEVLAQFPDARMYEYTDLDKAGIKRLAEEKYSSWDWVYGTSPRFSYNHVLKYEKGLLDIGLTVASGSIEEIAFYGDFFGTKEIDDLVKSLIGTPYHRESVEKALTDVVLDDYIFGLSKELFTDSLFANSIS
ncbi:MAG: lipoate--protein ligase [Firmicutes bacterium HGW-Firmicutes-11]|nr:MAG: lipoate--protein ligase [Firmicutes bacterium HGW-Firmicutes-11]